MPLLLDLFCGAGGAAMGYHRAGFRVIGVDLKPQPHYPFKFYQGDFMEALARDLRHVDVIHASPPCQAYSTQTANRSRHQRLIPDVRDRLEMSGKPYVLENVEGARAELLEPSRLCGSSFGLDVRRHRYFETNWRLTVPPCNHAWQLPRFRSLNMPMVRAGRLASVVGVHGHLNYPGESQVRKKAMGVDWMTDAELTQAIPPAYTEHIGRQVLACLS
jgi:DNA (cytosine-5)-methyltransferase 1